jgi:carboxymethylenebutenolidase
MHVTCEVIDLPHLRLRAFAPVHPTTTRWPTVVAWSDIFQHTGPHVRLCTRLASHGFLVLTPELYGRFEPPGTVLRFEEDRQRALDAAAKMQLQWFDEDLAATLEAAKAHPRGDPARLAACGWCIGGHLAFRAAFSADVRVTACFYATGLHSNSLGAAVGSAPSLADAGRIRGELLMVWGAADPHIPSEGRQRIHGALAHAGTAFHSRTYRAEHAFMRDEGARWQPAAADEAFAELRSVLRPLQVS